MIDTLLEILFIIIILIVILFLLIVAWAVFDILCALIKSRKIMNAALKGTEKGLTKGFEKAYEEWGEKLAEEFSYKQTITELNEHNEDE